jgi:hypothetical protein
MIPAEKTSLTLEESSMRRDVLCAPWCALLSGLMLAACGGTPEEARLAPSEESLSTQRQALCSGTSVSGLSISGVSSWGGELAGSGNWAVSGGANAVRLEYWVDGSLRVSEERTGSSGTWYFSTQGITCGSHTFEVRAYPMVVDSAGNRTTCWSSPGMSSSQSVTQACPTASLSCSRNLSTGDVSCTGSGSGGAPPYQYYWQSAMSDDSGSWSTGWYTGGTSYTDWCPRGFYENGYYWNLEIQFRVVDSSGMGSNTAVKSFFCSRPN